MKEVKLPSGATLKISLSPFTESKALYQSLLKEVKGLEFKSDMEMAEIYKQAFCIGFSSPEVEKCLWVCLRRCTYDNGSGDLKIDDQTFESVEARGDYWTLCMEVAKENILPFVKGLSAEYVRIFAAIMQNPT